MLFDTHCHLTHEPLFARLPEVLAEARAAGVGHFLVPGTAPQDWRGIVQLAQQEHGIQAACGVHPWFADTDGGCLNALDTVLRQHASVHVGEIGLDFARARDTASQQRQTELFENQLHLAQTHRRSVVVHSVRAGSACLQSIKRSGFRGFGIVHAFSGSPEEARQWVKHGFKIGIGVLLLHDRADKLRRTAAALSLDDIVLETDAPYLLPHSNRPALVRSVAETLAKLHGKSVEEIAAATTRNAVGVLPSAAA